MSLPTWSVVAMVDEPAALVAAFAQHALAVGAQGVEVFLDNPNPHAMTLLADTAGCRVTLCDDAFWAGTTAGARPPTNVERQCIVAGLAMARCTSDWLLHCDCDEYLREPARLLRELAERPDEVTHVTVRMDERVSLGGQTGLYGGAFRRMHPDYAAIGPALHGPLWDYFHWGLSGHMMGKSFTRTGRGMRPTVHYATPDSDLDYTLGKPGPYARSMRMLHFDGMTTLHYAIKMLRRVLDPRSNMPRPMSAQRTAQIAHIRTLVNDPAALARLVVAMTSLTTRQTAQLTDRGVLSTQPFRPRTSDAVARLLTRAAIDGRLRVRHQAMLARHAPALLDAAHWDDLVAAAVALAENEVAGAEL
jgi:hypothetical protein